MSKEKPKLPNSYEFLIFDKTTSTNDEAKLLCQNKNLSCEDIEGNFILAYSQTKGRGRNGKEWVSQQGNLFLSLIIKPDVSFAKLTELPFVIALAVGNSIKACSNQDDFEIKYKWPNDIIVDNKKLAGILIETNAHIGDDKPEYVIIGIGVNIDYHPTDNHLTYPATSFKAQNIFGVTADDLFGKLFTNIPAYLERWRDRGFENIRDEWKKSMYGIGKDVVVNLINRKIEGIITDIDQHGNLLILDKLKNIVEISGGEILFKDISTQKKDDRLQDRSNETLSSSNVVSISKN